MNTLPGKLKLRELLLWVFVGFWTVATILDYINKHPIYVSSIEYFQYAGLYSFVTILTALIIFHFKYDKWTGFKIPVNGLTLTLLSLILSIALVVSHRNYAYTATDSGDISAMLIKIWSLIGFIFIFLFVLKSLGRVIYRRVFKEHIKSSYLVDLAFGIITFTLCLFILGLFGILNQNTIIAILFVFSLVNLFYLVQSFKKFFFTKIDISALNILGIASFCFLVLFILLNLIASVGPFPSGFDSRNFYLNISRLIADNHQLVEGYQPYYWSLFMSTGFALFDKVELALLLSYLGIVLTVLAANRFAERHLKLDVNMRLFCMLLFVVTPAVTNQMYTEHKVDLAMLFFQILSLDYMLSFLKKQESIDLESGVREGLKSLLPVIILVGLLSSFALGIKMINMFMVFTFMVLIWWDKGNRFGIAGMLCFTLLLFLYAGVDELSGLNKYHLSEPAVKLVLALLMTGCMAYSWYRHRMQFKLRAALTVIYLACCGILITPWMIKNYSEHKTLNPRVLLMGKDPGPNVTIRSLINNYEKSGN